jgi:hypothetical protein
MSGFNSNLIGSYNCTYGNSSYGGVNSQYGIGGAIGLAFSSIAEANQTKQNYNNYALSSGNHSFLSNGTHNLGNDYKIIKSDSCTRYEPSNGFCHGVTADGHRYTYMK